MPSEVTPRLAAFGMVEDAGCERAFRHEPNEGLARGIYAHFVNQREADSNRKPGSEPTLRPWETLPEEIRESNRQQADHIAIKLRAIRYEVAEASDARAAIAKFSAGEIELLAELEHTRWNAERWLAGWRYGPPGKRHERMNEYLVPWDELDDSIKKYDRDAITEIPKRLATARPPMKVVRAS